MYIILLNIIKFKSFESKESLSENVGMYLVVVTEPKLGSVLGQSFDQTAHLGSLFEKIHKTSPFFENIFSVVNFLGENLK